MTAALAEVSDDVMPVSSPASFRVWAVRESAYLDAAEGTDSTEFLFDLLRRFPSEARALLDEYIGAWDSAAAVASGGGR